MPPAIHASPNAILLRRRAVRGLTIGLVAAALLAFLGAMGTDEAPLLHRIAYWCAVIVPGSVLGFGVQSLILALGGIGRSRWIEIAVVSLLVSIPHSFLVIVATALFFGIGVITLEMIASFWIAVLVVTVVLTIINHLAASGDRAELMAESRPAPAPLPAAQSDLAPADGASPTPPPPPALPELPPLLSEKLPQRLRGARLIAIEAEDHYLRIHTDGGSDLVLMRMSDACALMEDASGMRVHRSWWVAQAAVQGQARSDSRVELAVKGGLAVPVSRARHGTMRDPAWGYAAG